MKKSYLFIAAAALFAACSSDSLTVEKDSPQNPAAAEQAVNFDVYVGRGLTRAGTDGPISNTEALQTGVYASDGFGVFGYYTDGERYSGITKPNFFYNQQVKYSGGSWGYDPLKYWPNEFGSDAISDQVDRLTLFAYAPWVEVTPLTGVVTGDQNTNIIGMSRNNVTGDPYVKYVATMDATKSVDLCYGVAANDFTSSNSSLNQNNIKKGKPYIDVVKPGIDANSKIKFDFKHATAQLKVTVDAVVNAAELSDGANVNESYTRIWIRSVTFEGITQKGSLNLNGGEWYDVNGTNKITTGSLTVYDGRKDGKEAILEASNETPSTINPKLIQSKAYTLGTSGTITAPSASDGPGVTKNPLNLFVNGGLSDPVFVIPTGEKMKVTIVYDVETVDPNLAYYLSDGSTLGSSIENSISKTIDTFGNITAGYCYTLNLHLGMRTVDFDAEVSAWQNMENDVDLPSNLQTFAAKQDATIYEVSVPAGSANFDYEFAISGLNASEELGYQFYAGEDFHTGTPTTNSANASGIAKQKITILKNSTTSNKMGRFQWYSTTTANNVILQFNQKAAPIDFTNLTLSGNTLTCTWGVSEFITMNALSSAGTVKVYLNGQDITSSCDLTDAYDKRITVPSGSVAGDVYEVTLQANDAPMESRKVTR